MMGAIKCLIGFIITSIWWVSSCVDRVDLNLPEIPDLVVVDGGMILGQDTQTLKLTYADRINKRVFKPLTEALVTVCNGQLYEAYLEQQPGEYKLPGKLIQPQLGLPYHVEIKLKDGTTFISAPEVLQPVIPIDALSFKVETQDKIINTSVQVKRSLFISAEVTIPESKSYYKINYDRVYIVSEFQCHPLKPVSACYIYDSSQLKPPILINASFFTPGQTVGFTLPGFDLDYKLAEKNSFRIRLESLSSQAYLYYTQLKMVLNSGQSIFDIAPAQIKGNLHTAVGSMEVLGYFRVGSRHEKVLFTTTGDFSVPNFPNPLCGIPGIPNYNNLENCCDCLTLPYSSKIRPGYW